MVQVGTPGRQDAEIALTGAREHNLRELSLRLPRGRLVVVTGVSGSGKSSLAMDVIGREGQRRFLETLPAYARQFLGRLRRPAVDRLDGLSPAVLLDQRPGTANPRSTVGTMTEIWDLLRLLYARAGTAPPDLVPTRSLFSFNTPEGACPRCQGLGLEDRLDPDLLVVDPARSLRQRALAVSTPNGYLMYSQVTLEVLDQVLAAHDGSVDTPWRDLTDEQRRVVLFGSDRIRIPFGKHPLESRLRWTGITPRPRAEGLYKGLVPVMEGILRGKRNPSILRFVRSTVCSACSGTRLRDEARSVTFHGRDITELGRLAAGELAEHLGRLSLGRDEARLVEPIRAALQDRLNLLAQLGLAHLTLDRPAATLSAGEAQRARLLPLAVGSLRGLLFVLDEPSMGLHSRDVSRLLGVLRRLRDAGNTVLAVDHDETVVRAADWLVDLGPGAGADGGRLLWNGPPADLLTTDLPAAVASRTREWLTSSASGLGRPRRTGSGELRLMEVTRNNLLGVTVALRRGALNVITGVSGAGKTSLLQELLGRARSGLIEPPFTRVLEVDQSPIGRTPRSNPATYTAVFDLIRDLYAGTPDARAAGLGKGHFSFNVPGGRCEACEGAGVIEVGMRFLGTVEVPCEACGGRRFAPEVLAVLVAGTSIAEVLGMHVDEAVRHFASYPRIVHTLHTLQELGLGYLPLGQPAPTLSGGEAQRVKLAAELVRPAGRQALVALDEPTTGLHAADVAVLLAALDRLVEKGATVVVVEHDLQLVAAADWVVDLGPEAGVAGGHVVVAGTPEVVAAESGSHTGAALRAPAGRVAALPTPGIGAAEPLREPGDQPIRLRGVRTHNLQGVDVTIPCPGLTVITGPSGSGKSSLAHDTLAAEAHGRFADHLSAWARRFLPRHGASDLDGAIGLTPVVSLSQRGTRRNPRATVGSLSEASDLLRLVFARAGRRPCPRCPGTIEGASCTCGFRLEPPPLASSFSPSSEAGACPHCKGLGFVTLADPQRLVTHPERPLGDGALDGTRIGAFFGERDGRHVAILHAVGDALGLDFKRAWHELDTQARHVAMRGAGDRRVQVEWRFRRGSRTGSHRFEATWPGFCGLVENEYERLHEDERALEIEPLLVEQTCPACRRTRLAVSVREVRFGARTLPEVLALPVSAARGWACRVLQDPAGHGLGDAATAVTADAMTRVAERLHRLESVGLSYLSLDRELASLSAGEAQRLRLATRLEASLVGITHVLDEPTAGLHPRDTARLLGTLRELADAGNAVVVVEHDADIIAAADHIVELGPGAGVQGGRVVAQGSPRQLCADPDSATGELLRGRVAPPRRTRAPSSPHIELRGAVLHNLKEVDACFPGRALTVVSGVSGSGKSTLVFDLLGGAMERHLRGLSPGEGYRELVCHGPVTALLRADRHDTVTAAGSTVATFVGVWDQLRTLLARTPEAHARGLSARHFSLATPAGRCETCKGQGVVTVAMDFLPDVLLGCESCGGERFRSEVLAARLAGHHAGDLLRMTVTEVATALDGHQRVTRPLRALEAVGLGYLPLGQATSTLSGGELQRLRLAPVLAGATAEGTVVLLDEPTTGLHHRDVDTLITALLGLTDRGCTAIVVEHNLDLVAAADLVLDLGPEGGPEGGRVVACGSPEVVAATAGSHTGRALAARPWLSTAAVTPWSV